ncbi:MAG TPA: hypothetical protein VF867_15270 [Arthrobacter sp.]
MTTRATGTSLGGAIVHTRKPKTREKNPTQCPACGAGKGEPCFKNVPGRGLKSLHRTHRSPAPAKNQPTRAGHIKQAFRAAADLGPIILVPPAQVHVADGSPILGDGQAYVMRSGKVFHPTWCSIVAEKWDTQPRGLLVIASDTVGGRRECSACKDPLAV